MPYYLKSEFDEIGPLGPLGSSQIRDMVAAGKIDRTSLISNNPKGPWYEIGQVRALRDQFPDDDLSQIASREAAEDAEAEARELAMPDHRPVVAPRREPWESKPKRESGTVPPPTPQQTAQIVSGCFALLALFLLVVGIILLLLGR